MSRLSDCESGDKAEESVVVTGGGLWRVSCGGVLTGLATEVV